MKRLLKVLHIAAVTLTTIMALALAIAGWGGCADPHCVPVAIPLLVLALPVLAGICAVLVLAWGLARQWRVALVPTVAMLVALPALLTVCPVTLRDAASYDPDRSFTVMAFNAESFEFVDTALRHRPSENVRMRLRHDPDFVVLSDVYACRMMYYEMHSVQMVRDSLFARYPYRSDGHDRVILLSKYPFVQRNIVLPTIAFSGGYFPRDLYHHHAMAYDITMPDGSQFTIIGTQLVSFNLDEEERRLYGIANGSALDKMHNAWCRRASQARKLADIARSQTSNLIVCGDFNDVPASYAYRTLRDAGLDDARLATTTGLTPTYNAHHLLFTIDHILYRGNLCPVSYISLHEGTSDHYPQLATFTFTAP